jgi:hypothetical protein
VVEHTLEEGQGNVKTFGAGGENLLGLWQICGVVKDRRLHDDVKELLRADDEETVDGDLCGTEDKVKQA